MRVVVLLLPALLCACSGSDSPEIAALPDGSFAFAAYGDAPYSNDDLIRVERLIREINAQDIAFVINIGDILWYPCSDSALRHRLDLFGRIRHPVVYTPGDNEWADCHGAIMGRFDPLERLSRLRQIFFAEPGRTLGTGEMTVEPQGPDFPENAFWFHRGIAFATLHVVGSHNGSNPFPGRGAMHDEEVRRREQAVLEWLDRIFARARAMDAPAIVLGWHAAPAFEKPVGHEWRAGFEAILERLELRVADWQRPVLLIHGDDHEFRLDRPLRDRRTGETLHNFTRLEVMGSPDIGWVRVVADPDADSPFTVEAHRVGRGWWYLRRLLHSGSG